MTQIEIVMPAAFVHAAITGDKDCIPYNCKHWSWSCVKNRAARDLRDATTDASVPCGSCFNLFSRFGTGGVGSDLEEDQDFSFLYSYISQVVV